VWREAKKCRFLSLFVAFYEGSIPERYSFNSFMANARATLVPGAKASSESEALTPAAMH
jgi:hypothetical protein